MNYTALRTLVIDTTENRETSFTDHIPDFVKQAENRIYNTVLFPALRKNVTGSLTSNNKFLACPTDFIAPFSLAVIDTFGMYSYLVPKEASFIREAYPNPNATQLPQYYAIFGPQSNAESELTLIVGPTPDKSYSCELHYFFYPQSIVTAGTSWLGDNFDTVLLYATLVEAYIYMKGEQDVFMAYEIKFKEALEMAKRLGNGLQRGDIFRNGNT